MLRSILVPLDGSRFAEAALPIASRLAQASGATLHLVLAHDPTQGIGPFAEFGPPSVLLIEEMERREASYLGRTAVRLRKRGHLRVKARHEDGMAGRVIVEAAGRLGAGLVVMSTHGRGAFGRLGLGSVADYVVRHLDSPVLLVPARAEHPPRRLTGRRVLVPLDRSAESAAVLGPVEELSRLGQGTRITLLHVIEPVYALALPTMPYPMTEDPGLTELRWAQARRQLAQVAAAARRKGLSVSTRLVEGAGAAATILDVLHRGKFDLIAMTTHGYGGLRRLLLGSVTNKVIRHARKPVLVVRPPPSPPRPRSRRSRARRAAKK